MAFFAYTNEKYCLTCPRRTRQSATLASKLRVLWNSSSCFWLFSFPSLPALCPFPRISSVHSECSPFFTLLLYIPSFFSPFLRCPALILHGTDMASTSDSLELVHFHYHCTPCFYCPLSCTHGGEEPDFRYPELSVSTESVTVTRLCKAPCLPPSALRSGRVRS